MSHIREQRSWPSDPAVLAHYLPASVAAYIQAEPSASPLTTDVGPHVTRLQELLQHIVAYVPEYARAAAPGEAVAQPGRVSRVHGTLLAADLSGFTAFSAQLSTLGSEGAELVAHTISDLFSTLIDALGSWGGSLLKLSGDALTALFSGPDHVHRAVTAALELQKRMDAFQALVTPVGTFALRIRIGLASGDVVLAEVGSPSRIELLVAGETARRVIALQQRATPGAVVIGSSTYAPIAPIAQVGTLAAGLYRVLAIEPAPPATRPGFSSWVARHDPADELRALISRIESLRPYLVDQQLERLASGPPALASEGDLRPVTVLFACVSDATAVLERTGAANEQAALAQVQANAQRLWAIVEQYGGTINKLDLHRDGHTLIVLFGAPVVQGRDTQRAVGCALALLRERGAPAADAPLLVRRVGLATGRVFAGAVGSPERREYTVMGAVVNLAARLMDAAAEGQALIDVATAQVVRRQVRLQEQPPALIKGYEQPVPFFQVLDEQRSRLSALLRAQGALIGRAAELAQAQAAVARALAGHGGMLALVGEAGIGKSRLLAEIVRRSLAPDADRRPTPDDRQADGAFLSSVFRPPSIIAVQALPNSQGQPYSTIADMLWQLHSLPEGAEAAAAELTVIARQLAPAQERFLPLLPALFGLPATDDALTHALTPEQRRERLRDLVLAVLLASANNAPLALVLEDLHWADSASLDVLGALATAARATALLLLATYRREPAVSWPESAGVSMIELPPLTPQQSQELIASAIGGTRLSPDRRAAIVERTLGNPFFIAEITRTLRERTLSSDDEPPLPASIHSALLARLDRLSFSERYVLQLAAVIGPLFDRLLLTSLVGDGIVLEQALDQLADLGLVRQNGDGEYTFEHSLMQETAYESMLFAQRRELHRQIAAQLRDIRPPQIEANPGTLAYHYRRAEAWPEALEFAWQAGLRAQALYASDIALRYYRHAIAAIERIADPVAERRLAAIYQRMGELHALAGRATDAAAAYQSALHVAHDPHQRADVLIYWAELCEQQADHVAALALLEQAASQVAPDELLALRIAVRQGWVLIRQGSAEAARAAVEPCLEPLEQAERWPDLLLAYKVFFQIALDQCRWSEARSYLRLALACAERTDDTRELARLYNNLGVVLGQEGSLHASAHSFERAARVMEQIGDRYNLALFTGNIGVVYYKLGDYPAALAHYQASLNIAAEISNPSIEGTARGNLGEIYRRLGQLDESVAQLLRSVELCENTQDDLGLTEAYRQLAETYIACDQLAEAGRAADCACATAITAGDAQSEAIAYRVRGMLAARRGDYPAALEDVSRSIRMLAALGSTHELGQSMVYQAHMLSDEGQFATASMIVDEAILLLDRAGAAADRAEAAVLREQIQAHMEERQQ